MEVSLHDLFLTPMHCMMFGYTIEAEDLSEVHGYTFHGGMDADFILHEKSGVITLEVDVSAQLSLMCDRCQKPFERTYDFSCKHIVKTAHGLEDEDLKWREASENTIVASDGILDTKRIAIDDFLLSLPPRFLCREDCKGLCPVCGCDLNETTCSCNTKGGAEDGSTEE